MKFDCKEIAISEEEFGCSILFSEEETGTSKRKLTINDLVHCHGQYLLLLRKYSEDEFEEDYLYIETANPDKSGELTNFLMNIQHSKFSISYKMDAVEINMASDDQQFEEVKHIIEKITDNRGRVVFFD